MSMYIAPPVLAPPTIRSNPSEAAHDLLCITVAAASNIITSVRVPYLADARLC